MNSLTGIRARCIAANDTSWYNRQYAHQIDQAGYSDYLEKDFGQVFNAQRLQSDGKADIFDYPLLDAGEVIRGVSNHMLVNARIALQDVVITQPKIHLGLADDTEREIGEVHFEDAWVSGDWSEPVMMTGMNVFANAIGFMVCGPKGETQDEQVVDWRHVDVLDMLFDTGYKEPGRWRWFCYRERVPLDDAVKRYGHIFNQDLASKGPKERADLAEKYGIANGVEAHEITKPLTDEEIETKIKALCVKRQTPMQSDWFRRWATNNIQTEDNINDEILIVWHYWDEEHHVQFLCSIDGANSVPLTYRPMAGPDSAWNYQICTQAGPNDVGILTWAWWLDSWATAIGRPTPKSETVKPISDMIRWTELSITKILKQSLPMLLASDKLSPEMRAQWKKAIYSDDPMQIIENDTGMPIKDFFEVVAPDISRNLSELIQTRAVYKAEMSAVTGVTAPSRGESSGKEKTRKQHEDDMQMGGTQQRHLRNQYAKFIERMVKVTRAVGAIVDTKPRVIMLEDGPIALNKGGFPIAQFLAKPCSVFVDPTDFIFRAQEDIRAEAIAKLQHDLKGVELGIVHPGRAFEAFEGAWDGKHAKRVMFTPQELEQNQKAKQQAAQAAKDGAVKEIITAALKDLEAYPQLVQRWAEKVGLLHPGEQLQPAEPTQAQILQHTMKVAADVHGTQSAQAAQQADHSHERMMEAMKPHPQPTAAP